MAIEPVAEALDRVLQYGGHLDRCDGVWAVGKAEWPACSCGLFEAQRAAREATTRRSRELTALREALAALLRALPWEVGRDAASGLHAEVAAGRAALAWDGTADQA